MVIYLPTINWQKRAVRRIPKEEIDKILLPSIPTKTKVIGVRAVLLHALKQKEMRMQDMYSYMARMEKEIKGFQHHANDCQNLTFKSPKRYSPFKFSLRFSKGLNGLMVIRFSFLSHSKT